MAMHNVSHRNNFDKVLLFRCLIILPFVLCGIILQVSFFDVFGKTPALTLCLVSAIGFVFGERAGGIYGVCVGFMLDMLGGSGLTLSPLFYMLAGYFFGYLQKVFLRKNFLSFVVYTLISGTLKSILTLGFYTLKSNSFNIIKIFVGIMIPEFFAYIIFAPAAYFLCLGIEKMTRRLEKQG